VLSSMLIMAGCASLTNLLGRSESSLPVNDVACRAFGPITWSPSDTDETLRQIREHNAAWTALCRGSSN
jgi:hypothetical protein